MTDNRTQRDRLVKLFENHISEPMLLTRQELAEQVARNRTNVKFLTAGTSLTVWEGDQRVGIIELVTEDSRFGIHLMWRFRSESD